MNKNTCKLYIRLSHFFFLQEEPNMNHIPQSDMVTGNSLHDTDRGAQG